MSRTRKDERSRKTVTNLLQVLKNADGTYEIWYKGKLACSRVQEHWLYKELCVRYGFCGDEYEPIIHQLHDSGKATVML